MEADATEAGDEAWARSMAHRGLDHRPLTVKLKYCEPRRKC